MIKELAILSFLLASTQVFAVETNFMQGLGDVYYHRSNAEQIGRDFHIYVMLPDGYESSNEDYPTVYLLDGGNLFPMLVPYYRYLNFGEGIPDSIIVGISYGSEDFATGNFRGTDYTAPSEEREYWGGAEKFQAYLAETLLPFIESNYRSDASQRVVFGQSLGGQFSIYTALTRPNLFWGHIASNAAMHRNLPFFLRSHSELDADDSQSKLFIGTGSADDSRFKDPRDQWIAHWIDAQSKPWQLKVAYLEGHTHMSTPPASFRQGMRWLFADE